jgi:ATP-dependent Clp protease ATP-binding subunit ClpA
MPAMVIVTTVIIMTSNAGTDTFMKLCADPETRPDPEALADAIRPDLLKYFKPAFLGRLIVVPYYPISPDIMRRIIELQLSRVRSRIKENHRGAILSDFSRYHAAHHRIAAQPGPQPHQGESSCSDVLR